MGFPPRVMVRAPHHGDARLPGSLPWPGCGGPRVTSRTSGPSRAIWGTRRPRRCGATASGRTSTSWRPSPRARSPQRRLVPEEHPGQARGGVDTAWRGSPDPVPVPTAVRLSGASRASTCAAPICTCAPARRPGRGSACCRSSTTSPCSGPGERPPARQIRPGDTVTIDNSGYLAAETYHRHQVPEGGDFEVWDQFRNPDGSPIYPQRPLVLGTVVRRGRGRIGPIGPFRGQDDRGRVVARPGGAPVAGRLVPLEGARAPGQRHRRALPPLVHGQRVARRRRAPGEPSPHGQLPRHAASGPAGSEPMGGGGRRAAGRARATRWSTGRSWCRADAARRGGIQPVVVPRGERRSACRRARWATSSPSAPWRRSPRGRG